MAVFSASFSASSRVPLTWLASASAAFTRSSAQSKTSESLRRLSGMRSTDSRRSRAAASVARRRARPTWPPHTDAAHVAIDDSMPSRSRRTSAIAGAVGVRSAEVAAPRADRHRDVLRVVRRRGQQEHRPLRRLLDRLQQRVRRALGQAVGVGDDHYLPAGAGRPACGDLYQRAHLGDRDRQALRDDHVHVRVGAGHRRAAAGAGAAADAGLTLQRGRERAGRDRPAGAGRAGEQPRVRHRGRGRR